MKNQRGNHIWHPFTQMKKSEEPIHIVKAKDCTLVAADGKTYLDAISSWWVNLHGHSNKFIARKIAEQSNILEHVIFAGFTHTPAIELSEKLIAILPDNFKKVFFSDDGSTSVEVAIKMVFQYWFNKGESRKIKLIAFENAYHGDTFGAMSASARNAFNIPFAQNLFDVHHIPLPDENNIEEVCKQFTEIINTGSVAAFIFEPLVQGSAGMYMYDATHLDLLISIAQQQKVFCIADEVMTGFGRTGKNFAIDYLKYKPDIICLSKGITGGFMPLGVTICSQQIYDAFYADELGKTFFHGHSYTANPLACTAANASIELLLKDACQQKIGLINSLHNQFKEEIKNHDIVKEIRIKGTILAIELNTSDGSSYFHSIKKEAYDYFLSKGILLRPLGNVIYILPPYCITEDELNRIYNTIKESFPYLQDCLQNMQNSNSEL